MEESRIYQVICDDPSGLKAIELLTDSDFMTLAEEQGLVWSSQESFDEYYSYLDEIPNNSVTRVIKVETEPRIDDPIFFSVEEFRTWANNVVLVSIEQGLSFEEIYKSVTIFKSLENELIEGLRSNEFAQLRTQSMYWDFFKSGC